MSTISASTTTTTAYVVTADTTGALVLQTGATPTTALTISSAQVVTLANALPAASGGTGVTTSTGTGANVLATSPTITTPTISGDASINGLTVGEGGGSVATNTVVGAGALALNSTGTNNTAIGGSALSVTTVGRNTAIGYVAGLATTTGHITAVGAYALYSNTTGNSNVAVGGNNESASAALQTNTTGSNNTAVGVSALQASTTGGNNTAIGKDALYANTTASDNTAVGYQAGYANTTGVNNTTLGSTAGSSLTTQSYNTIIGARAGASTTGTQNTFIGEASGQAVTSGTRNTILGRYDGNSGGLDIRTASNYIVLSDGDGNPRGIFTNNGYLCIGGATTTTYSESLRINTANQQGIHINDTTSSSSINYQYFTKGSGPTNVGAIYYNGSVMAYQTTSDYRLKENVAPITNALNKIALLNPVTYRWKDNQQSGEGFIAHELQEHFPDAVSGTKDEVDENGNPKYQGMDASVLIGTMVKAIQELKAELDTVKAELAALKG